MTEEWKQIGIGNYAISNFGNVRGKDGIRLLKGCFVGSGHMTVNIYDGVKSKTTYIHHLVAKNFIPKPEDPDKKIIDHINGDKQIIIIQIYDGSPSWKTPAIDATPERQLLKLSYKEKKQEHTYEITPKK